MATKTLVDTDSIQTLTNKTFVGTVSTTGGIDTNVVAIDSTQLLGYAWEHRSIGQCRLTYVSATSIKLIPYNGNRIPVKDSSGWKLRTISSSGISAANTSVYVGGVAAQNLAASTVYYVYLFDNAGTLTVDFRVTAHAVDTDTGVEICSGVATRTLIGMVYTNVSSQFEDSATGLRHVASWFNRRCVSSSLGLGSNQTTASTAWAELSSTIRPSFLVWSGCMAQYDVVGAAGNSGINIVQTGLSIDSSGTPLATTQNVSNAATYTFNCAVSCTDYPSEGRHYVSVLVATNGGTSTYYSTDAANAFSGKVRATAVVEI